MRVKAALIIVLLLGTSGLAQQKSPCAEAELRVSMLEARLTARRIEAELSAARIEALERELAKLRGDSERELANYKNRVGGAERQAGAEREKAASISDKLQKSQQRIADLEKALTAKDETVSIITAERDKSIEEVRRARTWRVSLARVFGIKKR